MKAKRPTAILGAILILLLVLLMGLPATLYVVDKRELAVVLQFGKPVAKHTTPGLYFKIPFIQNVVTLPRTRQFWGDDASNPLSDLPTKDDKKIEIVPWAVWRVNEPKVFVQTLITMDEGERRVSEFVRGAIRDVITQYDLAELVRSTDRTLITTGTVNVESVEAVVEDVALGEKKEVKLDIQYGRLFILEQIKNAASELLTRKMEGGQGRGIELIDMGISQIEFVESVQRKTFDRWIAERMAIAALNVNEGERMKQEIINLAKREVQQTEGEGQREANEIIGEVDAEIIRNYASAITKTGEFYNFIRTLEVYQKGIGSDTTLILTTNSDLLGMLKKLEPVGGVKNAGSLAREVLP